MSVPNKIVYSTIDDHEEQISQVHQSRLPILSILPKYFSFDNLSDGLVRNIYRFLAASLAGLHTWVAILSQSMNADGVSYLDIGDAYFRGDWANAINPVWPPLYSWILGLVNFVFKPGMAWQFPIVHIVNFVIFIGTLVCFEAMWGKLRKVTQARQEPGIISLPGWGWWALGYSLFIWITLSLIQMWAVTPDMLMAGLVFLTADLVIQIRTNHYRWRDFIYLGLVLGLGYLTKTFMFSIALVILGLCLLLLGRTWGSIAKVALSTGIFLFLCLPFIFLISEKKGHLTIGEAGSVTYLRYVHGIPFPHWQGDPEHNIVLKHPSRVINQTPPIYEFSEPIGGTYPISTDPSYWFEGITLPFNLRDQLARLFSSSLYYLDLFFLKQGFLLASVVALYVMGERRRYSPTILLRKWTLVVPAVIAFGLYGLVLVSGRYIGVFILLFWADILANIRLIDTVNNRNWLRLLIAIAIFGVMVNIIVFNLDGFNRLNPSLQANLNEKVAPKPATPLEVAEFLQTMGLVEGDKVGVIGYGFDSFWARLVKVKIVAEMLDTQAAEFWLGDQAIQARALGAFATTGAKAIVAEAAPFYARLDGWFQVGNSNTFVYWLKE